MKKLFSILSVLLFVSESKSQTVNDILDDGIVVGKNDKIYLQPIGKALFYNLKNNSNFKPLADSAIILIPKTGMNVHLPALNPLQYSYDTALVIIADPIATDQDNAFSSIYSRMESIRAGSSAKDSALNADCPSLTLIVNLIMTVSSALEGDQKSGIHATFNKLRNLDFSSKTDVKNTAEKLETDSIKRYRTHYSEINKDLDKINTALNNFKCRRDDSIVLKYVLVQIYKDLKTTYGIKKTRLDNLEKAFKIVSDYYNQPNPRAEYVPTWFNDVIYVKAEDKKLAILTVTINYSGMEEKDGEIVTTEKRTLVKRVLRFRKFQRFIPEVSAGVAYVDLAFPKYGTGTNGSGQTIVAAAGEEKFKKLNLTGMVNFLYYAENSNVNPLIQIGVGQNSDYPILMLGVGLRFNTGVRRFAFSVGGASSWIKTLNKLKIGDPVSGTSDIDKDLIHEFKPPKIYFGIQYNF